MGQSPPLPHIGHDCRFLHKTAARSPLLQPPSDNHELPCQPFPRIYVPFWEAQPLGQCTSPAGPTGVCMWLPFICLNDNVPEMAEWRTLSWQLNCIIYCIDLIDIVMACVPENICHWTISFGDVIWHRLPRSASLTKTLTWYYLLHFGVWKLDICFVSTRQRIWHGKWEQNLGYH